jgi:hypothetical protein
LRTTRVVRVRLGLKPALVVVPPLLRRGKRRHRPRTLGCRRKKRQRKSNENELRRRSINLRAEGEQRLEGERRLVVVQRLEGERRLRGGQVQFLEAQGLQLGSVYKVPLFMVVREVVRLL